MAFGYLPEEFWACLCLIRIMKGRCCITMLWHHGLGKTNWNLLWYIQIQQVLDYWRRVKNAWDALVNVSFLTEYYWSICSWPSSLTSIASDDTPRRSGHRALLASWSRKWICCFPVTWRYRTVSGHGFGSGSGRLWGLTSRVFLCLKSRTAIWIVFVVKSIPFYIFTIGLRAQVFKFPSDFPDVV